MIDNLQVCYLLDIHREKSAATRKTKYESGELVEMFSADHTQVTANRLQTVSHKLYDTDSGNSAALL